MRRKRDIIKIKQSYVITLALYIYSILENIVCGFWCLITVLRGYFLFYIDI